MIYRKNRSQQHSVTMILSSLAILLLFISCLLCSCKPSQKPQVTLSFEEQRDTITVIIDSPRGISAAQVKLDIPEGVTVSQAELSGFMTGAEHKSKGTEHRWYTLSANGEKQGSLEIKISSDSGEDQIITLFGVELKDAEGNKVKVQTELPLVVHLGSIETETIKPLEKGPTEEAEQAEDRLSFEAAEYTNAEYGFSVKYPKEWKRHTMSLTGYLFAVSSPDIITSGGYNIPIMLVAVDKGNTFSDAIISNTPLMSPKLDSVRATTLADGTEAYECKISGTFAGALVEAFVLGVEREDYWIVVSVATAPDWAPYNEALFSEIVHTLSTETPTPPPAPAISSSGGGKIAFVSYRDGNSEIYLMNADGNQIRLTNNPGADWQTSWSPDGKKIAFVSDRDGNNEIYVMDADGSRQTRLTYANEDDLMPVWSPDGSKIAFYSHRDGRFQIYAMNADGTNQTELTHNYIASNCPSWSPNGSKIAFNSSEIYVIDPDGNNQTRITNFNNNIDNGCPLWSPDGSKIAFGIYVMNSDGSNQIRLTNNSNLSELVWSPDSKKIAFVSGHPEQIWITNADGSSQTRLTHDNDRCYSPSWSPDGTKIAFVSIHEGTTQNNIYIMNTDGSNQVPLTNGPSDSSPVWSPR